LHHQTVPYQIERKPEIARRESPAHEEKLKTKTERETKKKKKN